ncbi:MAG: hypothetical protein ACHQAX_08955 [Gammaproteobacteria bacterium]
MSYMSNNANDIPKKDQTFYATPKMAAASIASDVVWQLFSQFFDPLFEDDYVGAMNAVTFMGIFYPFFMTALVYGASRLHSYQDPQCTYNKNKSKFSPEDWDRNGKATETKLSKDKDIAAGVFLGMAGWMCGYYLSDEAFGFGRWGTTTAVGVGSTIPLLIYSLYNDKKSGKDVSKETYMVLAASFFIGGLSWYLCYLLPGIMVKAGFPDNSVAGGFASTCATGLTSAASLGMLYLWENKDKGAEKKSTSNANLSAATEPLLSNSNSSKI